MTSSSFLASAPTTALQTPSSKHRLVLGWTPTQEVIPAVPGEFYAYPADFTKTHPLYPLLKCKSNKARAISDAAGLGSEANLVFHPDTAQWARVSTAKIELAHGLFRAIASQPFGDTWIKAINMSPDEFYGICQRRDAASLKEICQEACAQHEVHADLQRGTVVAMMTDGGKYGLFLVTELTPELVAIDACHVLLP
ncbi:MAG TPA: hypothetical protein VGE35_01065 [Candidatus Paceibacterota bacterium]